MSESDYFKIKKSHIAYVFLVASFLFFVARVVSLVSDESNKKAPDHEVRDELSYSQSSSWSNDYTPSAPYTPYFEPSTPPSPPPPPPSINQRDFTKILLKYKEIYRRESEDNPSNQTIATEVRYRRRTELMDLDVAGQRISDWFVCFESALTNTEGLAHVTFLNHCTKGIELHAEIPRNDYIYPTLLQLRQGQRLNISGMLKRDSSPSDYFDERSLTESGSLDEPEFNVILSDIEILQGSVKNATGVGGLAEQNNPIGRVASAQNSDWGNDIQTHLFDETCPIETLKNNGYTMLMSSDIPLSRVKDSNDAWWIIGARATTVVGCWYPMPEGKAMSKTIRKKGLRNFGGEILLTDGNWAAGSASLPTTMPQVVRNIVDDGK